MAEIVTQSIPVGVTTIWDNPSSVGGNQSGIPIAKIVFNETVTVPAKVNTDTSRLDVTCVLPVNYVYRLSYSQMFVQALTIDPYIDFSASMVLSIADATGLVARWLLTNDWNIYGPMQFTGSTAAPFRLANFVQEYRDRDPALRSSLLINNAQGGGALTIDWIDPTNDATIAVEVHYRFELMMYTLDALNSYRLNTPDLVFE